MTNARIITAATIATVGAAAYRDQTSIGFFSQNAGADFDVMTENKKAAKPVFEVHERETAKREFTHTLMRRNNANKLTVIDSIKLGLYGKRLDAPAPQAQEPAAEVETPEAVETEAS